MLKVSLLVLLSIVILLVVFVAFRLLGEASRSQSMHPQLGVTNGQFVECPSSPNCVSSQASDEEHGIAAIADADGSRWDKLQATVLAMPGAALVENHDDYIRFTFTTSMLGFIDDVEFLYQPTQAQIAARSASRVGTSDLGANRKRIEAIRSALNAEH